MLLVQFAILVVTMLAALGVGWVWGSRHELRRFEDGEGAETAGSTSSAGSPTRQKTEPYPGSAGGGGADSMFQQLLDANEELHRQLGLAEKRIRELVWKSNAPMAHHSADCLMNGNAPPQPDSTDEFVECETATAAERHDKNGYDQRTHKRRKLLKDVMIAPFVEGVFPTDFDVVKGYDISEAGISFFLSTPPTTDVYLVVFGNAAEPIYVKAHVVRVADKHAYLVGCRFIGRIDPPKKPLSVADARVMELISQS